MPSSDVEIKIEFKPLKKDEKYLICSKCGKSIIHKKSIKYVGYKQVPKNCYQCLECGKKT